MSSPTRQLNVDEYHVGWICALPSEYAAAMAMLDEEHQAVSGQHRLDTNSYTLGCVHKHNVVIACLPVKDAGTNAAVAVATNLSRTFGSIRFGLMVGIGGGIPNLSRGIDIRLGDVAVSQPSNRNGGVVQHDKGKSYDGGRFELNGHLGRPPEVLLKALLTLQARHELEDSKIPVYLTEMLEKRPKMKPDYSFPTQETDNLQCTHVTEVSASCEQCEDGKTKRVARESKDPVIHYGAIASGNGVIKSAAHRDRIRDVCDGAICVEMEAAGLMNNFPCLVVRGICDYADSSKNEQWHNYASATAAAFAKELLLYVSVEQTSNEQPISAILSLCTEIREHYQRQAMDVQRQEIQKMPYVAQAMYGAEGESHKPCYPGTRVALLESIWKWTHDVSGKSIFWLNGVAGTGKSTISWTVAEQLSNVVCGHSVVLGASFFFKRGEDKRTSAVFLFPTIAYQLAFKIPQFDTLLGQALKDDPQICTKAIDEQFRKLILRPLEQLEQCSDHVVYIIVVDALDECESDRDIHTILELWHDLSRAVVPRLRLFLTSRPEMAIRLSFTKMKKFGDGYDDQILHEIPHPVIRHDIELFLTAKFDEFRRDYNLLLSDDLASGHLANDWPGSDVLQKLISISMPLFIMAATICRLIDGSHLPQQDLKTILDAGKNIGLSDMSKVYTGVLQAMTASYQDGKNTSQLYDNFRTTVGAIILLAEPLSRNALAALLHLQPYEVEVNLRTLHAVLEIPPNGDTVIRPLHLSFGEYLTGQEAQKTRYGIDAKAMHSSLWRQCLQLLSRSGGLRENICDLEYPGQPRSTVSPAKAESGLRSEIRYACRHWVYHVKHSGYRLRDEDEVHTFLKKHFLHWLEALSLIDQVFQAINYLPALSSCLSVSASLKLTAFLADARRFVLAHRQVIDLAPLQLYSSAIIFTPENSVVRQVCGQVPSWIRQYPQVVTEWGSELQTLEGHSKEVYSVAFSPDGSLLASASGDQTVRVWETSKGRTVHTLAGHSAGVDSIAFSSNSFIRSSASRNRMLGSWEARIGRTVHALRGHSDKIYSVAFSPDGSHLVSSAYQTAQMWETHTGRKVHTLEGHTENVYPVAFSPDGSLLASASGDQMVRVWETLKGRTLHTLGGHSRSACTLAFSPDGSLFASASASASAYEPVKLWETQTGRALKTIYSISTSSTLSFTDNTTLVTEQAASSPGFDTTIGDHDVPTSAQAKIKVLAGWIRQNNQNLLWLPHKYRGTAAFYGNKLAIGAGSGRVSIFELDF